MNVFLFIFFSYVSVHAQVLRPERGLYKCTVGNEESICDQILKPYFTQDKLTALKVEYVGWCGSMGPYNYFCQGSICEDAGLKFEFRDSTHYRWENKQYGLHCEFEKK